MSHAEINYEPQSMDLHRACRIGDLNAIQFAYEAQPQKINEKDAGLGWAPLYRSVICGHYEASEYLLSKGADPNISNNLGETPLHQAADNSQYQMAELLLANKANPNFQQNDGDSPLHHSAFRGDAKMIKLLLEFGADPNLPNYMFGRTPLHYAVDCGYLDCVRIMVSHGADPSIRDKQGKSAYDLTDDGKIFELLNRKMCNTDLTEEHTEEQSAVFLSPNSVFMSPSSQGALSPISEVVSYDFSDFGVNDKSNITQGQVLDTFGKDKETKGNSYHDTTVQSSTKSHRINKDYELKPLFNWLDKLDLSDLYEIMVSAGYDDVQSMSAQMLTPMPITELHLASIGIVKPGHYRRILMKLEEEAGLFRINPRRKPQSADCTGNKGVLKCCATPDGATAGIYSPPTIKDWLDTMSLGFLLQNFIESGYDDYESMMLMMFTHRQMTHEILEKDLKIKTAAYRKKILNRLEQDKKYYAPRFQMSPEIVYFEEPKGVACEMCVIM